MTKLTLEEAIAATKEAKAKAEAAEKLEQQIRVEESKRNLLDTLDMVVEYSVAVNAKDYGKEFVRDAKSKVSKIINNLWGEGYKAIKSNTSKDKVNKVPVVMEDIVEALKERKRNSKENSVGKKELEGCMVSFYKERDGDKCILEYGDKFDHNKWAKADKSMLNSSGEKINKVFWVE